MNNGRPISYGKGTHRYCGLVRGSHVDKPGGQECRIGVQHGRQPPAQLGGISVGISVTTWGARHHGNIAVPDDSCAGPSPLLTPSPRERHHGNTVQPPLLTHFLPIPLFLTPLNCQSSSNTHTKLQFLHKIANFTPNCNFS